MAALKKVEEQLAEYRRRKALETERSSGQNVELAASSTVGNGDVKKERSFLWLCRAWKIWDDLLDVYPLRAWRTYMDRSPRQCLCVTLCIWLILQFAFAYAQFGFVFFIFPYSWQ